MLSDLECPGCGAFHTTLVDVLGERAHDVRALFVSLPLEYHRFALPAARAAECAEEVGRFRSWIDVVYDNQDSLGLKSWASYGADAGIVDTLRIGKCAASGGTTRRIQAGLDFGSRISFDGTPTVLINGWRFPAPPSKAQLTAAIDAVLAGKRPESMPGNAKGEAEASRSAARR